MNNDYMIALGSPPGIEIDMSETHYVKTFAKTSTSTLLEEVNKILANKFNINLALSGGLDSQFSLLMCLKLNKNITAFTYRTSWNGIYLNTDDVYIAELLCKKYNVSHHIIDIDLNNFFNTNQHFKYGEKFFNSSPQLSVHFYFIELLKTKYNIDHILLGGDPPLMQYQSNFSSDNNIRMSGENFYQDIMAPYHLFCKSIDVECIRDVYYHSPEAVYCAYKNNLEVVTNKGIHFEKLDDNMPEARYKQNKYLFKFQYYNNIINGLLPQISETTGFEKLKKILAMESGVYNQFDILYRKPMRDKNINSIRNRIFNQVMKGKRRHGQSRNIIYDQLITDLYKEFNQLVLDTNSTQINQYSFDF